MAKNRYKPGINLSLGSSVDTDMAGLDGHEIGQRLLKLREAMSRVTESLSGASTPPEDCDVTLYIVYEAQGYNILKSLWVRYIGVNKKWHAVFQDESSKQNYPPSPSRYQSYYVANNPYYTRSRKVTGHEHKMMAMIRDFIDFGKLP